LTNQEEAKEIRDAVGIRSSHNPVALHDLVRIRYPISSTLESSVGANLDLLAFGPPAMSSERALRIPTKWVGSESAVQGSYPTPSYGFLAP
jgi:hypothetical protein